MKLSKQRKDLLVSIFLCWGKGMNGTPGRNTQFEAKYMNNDENRMYSSNIFSCRGRVFAQILTNKGMGANHAKCLWYSLLCRSQQFKQFLNDFGRRTCFRPVTLITKYITFLQPLHFSYYLGYQQGLP